MTLELFWNRIFRHDENSAWRLWGVWVSGKTFIGVSRQLAASDTGNQVSDGK